MRIKWDKFDKRILKASQQGLKVLARAVEEKARSLVKSESAFVSRKGIKTRRLVFKKKAAPGQPFISHESRSRHFVNRQTGLLRFIVTWYATPSKSGWQKTIEEGGQKTKYFVDKLARKNAAQVLQNKHIEIKR